MKMYTALLATMCVMTQACGVFDPDGDELNCTAGPQNPHVIALVTDQRGRERPQLQEP